ncbi:hypothetical protein KSP40_PGU022189 [Platanthera guangdongensis]|uniref:Uncharacterized protein n=1 Tax=Platanthera guangdongensis TaxID=2320717 RepID=A0ABR2LJ12_9ASPA
MDSLDMQSARPSNSLTKSSSVRRYVTLIRGYRDELKLEYAKRLMGEIIRGGFDLGMPAYNSIIDCVCQLCHRKDPLWLLPVSKTLQDEIIQDSKKSGDFPRAYLQSVQDKEN